jgi:RNA polymerase sigma factor (sigma-70 family)
MEHFQESENDDVGALQQREAMRVRLQEGDTRVLVEILQTIGPKVESILRMRFSDMLSEADIEDVLSEALLVLWETRGRIGANVPLAGWFYILSRNIAINNLKRRRREYQCSRLHAEALQRAKSPAAAGTTTDQSVVTSERHLLVRKLFSQLGPLDREIVRGFLLNSDEQGWATELASQLDMTPNHVRVRWHRLKRILKKRLEEVRDE